MGTIITASILVVVVAFVLVKMIRDKIKGKSGCSCGCCNSDSCSGCSLKK